MRRRREVAPEVWEVDLDEVEAQRALVEAQERVAELEGSAESVPSQDTGPSAKSRVGASGEPGISAPAIDTEG